MTHQKITLDNGLRLLIEAMPHTRSVAINYFIGTGSRYETEKESGISHFVEHMCFKGTKKRPTSTEIATVVEGVGGMLNAGTDKELTVYWCKVADCHFDDAYDVMTDILLHSVFAKEEIDKERPVIVEEINMSLDSPQQRVSMLIDDIMWPKHPLGRDIAGTRESVAGIDRKLMLDYIKRQYQPSNVVLAIAGNIDPEKVIQSAKRLTKGWESSQPKTPFKQFHRKAGRRINIEKKDTEQTQLCLSLPGYSMYHPDRFILDLLNIIFGEGMSSRLFIEIRDKLGLAYSIQSYAEHFLDTGAMTISAGVDNKNLKVAIKAILKEMDKLKNPIPEAEIAKAKEMFKGRISLRMEDSRSVAGWMGTQEVLLGKIMSVDELIKVVDAITAEQLQKVAKDILIGEKLHLASVGPADPDWNWEGLLKL
jgi:predicted Zn-dependent peptidase